MNTSSLSQRCVLAWLKLTIPYDSLPVDYRERLVADRTWIEYEFDNYENYKPTDQALRNVRRPVEVLVGTESPPLFGQAAAWLAERLGTAVTNIPGAHGAHYANPQDVVHAIRAFVRKNARAQAAGSL